MIGKDRVRFKSPPPVALTDFAERLRKFWKGEVLWNCPLAYFSTLKVGGPARSIIMPRDTSEFSGLVKGLRRHGVPWRVIGRGSNILVSDQGFAGVVIVLGAEFAAIRELETADAGALIEVQSGCSLAKLVKWSMERELAGLEFAVGIPGSVGGAIVMNAGAHGGEIGALVESVSLVDDEGGLHSVPKEDCHFAYRGLRLEGRTMGGAVGFGSAAGQRCAGNVVLAATLRLGKKAKQQLQSGCRAFNEKRKTTQPQGVASAGSFFKNPATDAAGRLIEAAGLKGCRIGGAVVSERHANFIVNVGGATASDILELMHLVQEKVCSWSGIKLEPEVDVWE